MQLPHGTVWASLYASFIVVAAVVGADLTRDAAEVPDASIGGGALLLVLVLLGLPGSIVVLYVDGGLTGDPLPTTVLALCAMLNGAGVWWWTRRLTRTAHRQT